jgi:hypothetical protein
VITDARRVNELLVRLPDVMVLGVEEREGGQVAVHVEQAGERPACIGCGATPTVKERPVVELVDLPYAGRASRLCWHKVRWECPNGDCEMLSWTWDDPRIASTASSDRPTTCTHARCRDSSELRRPEDRVTRSPRVAPGRRLKTILCPTDEGSVREAQSMHNHADFFVDRVTAWRYGVICLDINDLGRSVLLGTALASSRRSGLDESGFIRFDHCLNSVATVELHEDVADVGLDGCLA